jgi:hypothetical protein
MARSRDISKVLSSNTTLATDAEVAASYLSTTSASTVYQTKATTGLNLINTTSFTSQSSVSIDDVFSSTYKSYKIIGYIQSSTTNANNLRFRLRASGTDLTSGIYRIVVHLGDTSQDVWGSLERSNSATSWLIDRYGGRGGSFEHTIHNPQLTNYTHFSGTSSVADESNCRNLIHAGMVDNQLSYTGFTILTSTENMTGRIFVYGFKE